MDVEDLDEVIYSDHAYACQRNSFVEDPLMLEPEVVIKTEIKTEAEDMEIKIEEPDTYEGENNEHLNFEPGETSFYDLDEVHDTANIEFVEHTTFENENGPSMLFLNLQDKFEANVPTPILPSTDKYVQENKKLKRTIAELKKEKTKYYKEKTKYYSSIESNSRKFYDDLTKMHRIQCDLQKEIKNLRDENEKYQSQLICYEKLKKHHLDLEAHILELRRQAHQFMKFEKIAIANIKTMKTDIDTKSNETKAARNRLAATVKRLSHLKATLAKLANINKLQSIKTAQCVELQAKLKSAVQMNKVYEMHLKSFKTQFDERIKEKQRELDIAKEEINVLKKSNIEKEATCNILKEKYKFSVEHQKKKMQANKKDIDSVRKQFLDVKNLLSLRELEKDELLTRIGMLEKELLDAKNKDCDYCGL